MSLHTLFHKIHQEELEKQEVNAQLQRQLAQQLFHSKHTVSSSCDIKKSRFSWKFFSTVARGMSVVVLVAFAVLYNSKSPESSSNLFANIQIIDPKVALAESLKNTFGTESFSKTFGLGDQHTFRHRRYVINVRHMDSDQAFEEIPAFMRTKQETIDVWGYEGNMRKDREIILEDGKGNEKTRNDSLLVALFEHQFCTTQTPYESAVSSSTCQDIDTYVEDVVRFNVSVMDMTSKIDESLIIDVETEPFYDEHNGKSVRLRWATQEPLKNAALSTMYFPDGGGGADIFNYKKNNDFFTNLLIDEKYWHGYPVTLRLENTEEKLYFQIKHKRTGIGSSIYEYTYETNTTRPISYEEYVQKYKESVSQFFFLQGSYDQILQPALYMMKYPEEFREPSVISENEQIQGVPATRMRFQLTERFNIEANTWDLIPFTTQQPTWMDIWYSPLEQRIVQYTIYDEHEQPMIDVFIAADEVVHDVMPETFFSTELWKKEHSEK